MNPVLREETRVRNTRSSERPCEDGWRPAHRPVGGGLRHCHCHLPLPPSQPLCSDTVNCCCHCLGHCFCRRLCACESGTGSGTGTGTGWKRMPGTSAEHGRSCHCHLPLPLIPVAASGAATVSVIRDRTLSQSRRPSSVRLTVVLLTGLDGFLV